MNMRKNSLSLVLGSMIALTATLGCETDATSESALSVGSAGDSAGAGRTATQGVNQNDRGSTGSVVGAAGSANSTIGTVGNTGGATTVLTNNVGSGSVGNSTLVTSEIGTGTANGGRGNSATGGTLPGTGGVLPSTSTAKTGGSSATGGTTTSKTGTGGSPGTGGSGAGGQQGLGGSKTGGASSTGGGGSIVPSDGTIGDHQALDDFEAITEQDRARVNDLGIFFGHRSHGNQIGEGNSSNEGGLVSLSRLYDSANLYLPAGLHEVDGVDLGTYLDSSYDWVEETNNYLRDNPGTDVVVWAWCSQLEESENGVAIAEEYLRRMEAVEAQYPDVDFVYMTQHLADRDYEYMTDETTRVQAANAVIRDYCEAHGKWLFDFADVGIYPTANGEVCRRYMDGDPNNDAAGDQGRGGELVPYDCGSETAQSMETGHTNLDTRIRRSKVFYWLLSQIAAARQ